MSLGKRCSYSKLQGTSGTSGGVVGSGRDSATRCPFGALRLGVAGLRCWLSLLVAVGFQFRGNTGWNQTVAILAQAEVPVGKTGLRS